MRSVSVTTDILLDGGHMNFTWPTPAQLDALNARANDPRPITMLNLLRYRDVADYTGHPEATPCSGKAAYARYADAAIACVESFGGRVVFGGAACATAIGPDTEQWHDVLLVEYPNTRAFLDMMVSKRYRAFAYHREAAIEDSRLVLITAGEPSFRM